VSYTLAGIDRPTSGQIEVAGVDSTALPESALAARRAAHVGFIFQFYNLMPVLTAFGNGLSRDSREDPNIL
jgi:putative ABC transport system ATP-binding protein